MYIKLTVQVKREQYASYQEIGESELDVTLPDGVGFPINPEIVTGLYMAAVQDMKSKIRNLESENDNEQE